MKYDIIGWSCRVRMRRPFERPTKQWLVMDILFRIRMQSSQAGTWEYLMFTSAAIRNRTEKLGHFLLLFQYIYDEGNL